MSKITNNTEFHGSVNAHDQRTVGRIIGHKGSGTKRITNKVKTTYHNSRCYIRGDRSTSNFQIKAYGPHGEDAVRLAATMINQEIDWINGVGECPHPNTLITHDELSIDHTLIPHIIGEQGTGIKNLMDNISRWHGPGCFIIHKPDLRAFLIEGTLDAHIQAGREALLAHVRRVKDDQTKHVVRVDLTRSKTTATTTTTTNNLDTNSFASLASSSSSSDSEDGDEDERKDTTTHHTHIHHDQLGFTLPDSRTDTFRHNREFNEARAAVAEQLGIEFRYVKDHQTNEEIRRRRAQTAADATTLADQTDQFDITSFESTDSAPTIKLNVHTPWSDIPAAVTNPTGQIYMQQPPSTPTSTDDKRRVLFNLDTAPTTPPTTSTPSVPPPIQPPVLKRQITAFPNSLGNFTSSWASDSDDDDDMPPLEFPPLVNELSNTSGDVHDVNQDWEQVITHEPASM